MSLPHWRSALTRRVVTSLIAVAMALVVVVGLLTTTTLLARHTADAPGAQPRTTTVHLRAQDSTNARLEVFEALQGGIYHRWSDDTGATWQPSSWASLGGAPNGEGFVGTPAVVSSGAGSLVVAARDTSGGLWINTFANNSWSGWGVVPGVSTLYPYEVPYSGVTNGYSNVYVILSDPALASWGPGRLDLFVYGRTMTGTEVLLHTWGNYGVWSGAWESLGSASAMQGNPAAVSWGSGRIDIFGRGGSNELEHKWFAGGWSGWENLGGILTSNPTVSSGQSSYLNIFVRNTNGGLSQRAFWPTGWGPWWNLDSGTISSSPASVESSGFIHVFALDNNGNLAYNHWYNQWWFGWSPLVPSPNNTPAVAIWDPTAGSTPPPPTPSTCGVPGQPPCPVTP